MFITEFWWIAPAAAGAGGVGYATVTSHRRRKAGTMSRRRAKRLELDGAQYGVQVAYRTMLQARADVRGAQARVQSAQAHRANPVPGVPTVAEAKRDLQSAKRAYKSATMALRASRTHVKAVAARHSAAGPNDPLPIERIMHEHDAVTGRWLAYETDALAVLSFPQLSDAQHPATHAFLRAQSEAHRLRPASTLARMRPEEYVAYREAVTRLSAAFAHAEAEARRAGAETTRRMPRAAAAPRSAPVVAPVPPEAVAAPSEASHPVPAPSDAARSGTVPTRSDAALSDSAPTTTEPEASPSQSRTRGVWPVPARTPRPAEGGKP